jgi:adenylate cyclase
VRFVSQHSIVRDALRRIQDLLEAATGRGLPAEAESRLEAILQSVARYEVSSDGDDYSHREVTVLLADLRGFAAIAESYPVRVVLDVLNRCFAAMVRIIVQHHGAVDKFMGDAIMVVFSGDEARDHARRAVLCAVEMQIAMNELRLKHKEEKVPEMFLGIGMNTGKVMAGLVGSDLYRAHTVIGPEVNLASRIEAFSLRGQVLISESTYRLCAGFAETAEPVHVYMKGKAQGLDIHEVTAIPSLGRHLPRQEMRRSPRVDVMLPFAFHMVEDKVVSPEPVTGTIRDIGYHGVLAELNAPLAPYSQIKLELDLATLGYRADDVYGRVVKSREENGRYFAGIEFTSASTATKENIQLFVQMLLQRLVVAPRAAGE